MARRLVALVALSSVLGVFVPPAAQEHNQADADRARDKIEAIILIGEEPPHPRPTPARTELNEAEINAYLRVYGPEFMPKGIAEPEIRLAENRIRARAIVDLDAVRKSRPRPWHDPLAYVIGSVEVLASGRVVAADGIGRAELESATVAGLSVPKSVVQELIRFYTTTPAEPDGFDLDKPFVLPANIRSVAVRRAEATIEQ
jgi:hypothetical protein